MQARILLIFFIPALLISTTGIKYSFAASPPPLTLAKRFDNTINLDTYWVSEKLDGVRAYWDGENLITRQGNVIKAPNWFISALPPQPLDGELWIGRGKFEHVVSTVRKRQPIDNEWQKIRYMIFDLPSVAKPFADRLAILQELIPLDSTTIKLIPHYKLHSHSELQQQLKDITEQGGEGLMLHKSSAFYRSGRSSDLLKLKTIYDAEAKVIGHRAGKGKHLGRMGSLLVETPTGLRFYIGSGFTDQQRQSPPPLGSMITYQYHGLTRRGIPRHASFLRIRVDSTL